MLCTCTMRVGRRLTIRFILPSSRVYQFSLFQAMVAPTSRCFSASLSFSLQMRSMGAESDRAYNRGPLPSNFYQQSSFTPLEAGSEGLAITDILADVTVEGQYANHLDWFAIDLEGEQSAMDSRILEEHAEYVVQAVHQILDRYRNSMGMRSQQNEDKGKILPTSVILVGHSMGGFVARAAVVHPNLMKGAVETILTLSSPHRSPPLAVQPSFGRFFSRVNAAWVNGYKPVKGRRWMKPPLTNVVVVSVTGGAQDYQIRSRMASLDGIVPSTNGMTISSTGIVNVFMSMEHQAIVWCNEFVVKMSHTLLQLIDKETGQPYPSPHTRLGVFVSNLRSALPQAFDLLPDSPIAHPLALASSGGISTGGGAEGLDDMDDSLTTKSTRTKNQMAGSEHKKTQEIMPSACPQNVYWESENAETDLHINTSIMTILAMDGQRRWLDIKKLASNGRDWFVLVTNLAPCVGLRMHLWPEKGQQGENGLDNKGMEVTMRMVQLPSGPTHPQIEPGGQTEQVSPTGVIRLGPKDLAPFRYLTVSVTCHLAVSGRPPPSAIMAVGQFFNPEKETKSLSAAWLLSSLYKQQHLWLREYHPMVWNMSVAVSLSTLPMMLDVRASSCGIQQTVLAKEHPEPEDLLKMCKARCFPPLALIWDPQYGLEVAPNLTTTTVVVDSSPAIWGSIYGSEHTTIMLLVDPHCAYDVTFKVSLSAAASRFLLVHGLQLAGLSVAVVLFALMRQARAWELNDPLPSIVTCIESNLRLPLTFFALGMGPILLYFSITIFGTETCPSLISFMGISIICYLFANGAVALLAYISCAVFYTTAFCHSFIRVRWQAYEDQGYRRGLRRGCLACSSLQMVRIWKTRPSVTVGIAASILISIVHPSLGLILLLSLHAWRCHFALVSHQQQKELPWKTKNENGFMQQLDDGLPLGELPSWTKPSALSLGETKLEIFYHHQGVLLLHLIATIMFIPSLVAFVKRAGQEWTLPAFLDSVLAFGLVLHGLQSSTTDANISLIRVPRLVGSPEPHAGLSFIYLLAGMYCYLVGLALAPYRAFYALFIIGVITAITRIRDKQAKGKGENGVNQRHFHRH
ncbi:hypothetical protein CY35_05G059400 [Sphagnum magellanicum]|nr:hypothetical protein CY35_05G059400 [Sphagnum magellanicum]